MNNGTSRFTLKYFLKFGEMFFENKNVPNPLMGSEGMAEIDTETS